MKVSIVNLSGISVPRTFLTLWTTKISRSLSQKNLRKRLLKKEVSIVFLDLKTMRETNFQFRGKNRPTDVLSFEMGDQHFLGELLISPHIAKAQAKENNHLYREELGLLILHGMLHLLGLDHEPDDLHAQRFFKIQNQMFASLQNQMSNAVLSLKIPNN